MIVRRPDMRKTIRNLISVAQSCVDAYNRRDEAIRAQSAAS